MSLRTLTAGQAAVKKEAVKTAKMNSAVRKYIFDAAGGSLELSEPEYMDGSLILTEIHRTMRKYQLMRTDWKRADCSQR